MCNNLVALGPATADGKVVFGKNSDRVPNEAHQVEYVPALMHPEGAVVRCTYVEIPQVRRTNAMILGRPCWTWGAEMGSNEHGVTIGNTAVFTKVPYQTGPGLLGMDLVRLALERASTAEEALDTLISLLETFGQGGNCGFRKKFYYHNSFLIADPHRAWVMETAGRHWVAVQVTDVWVTTNALTITSEGDRHSEGLVEYATKQGWHKKGRPFNFKKSFGGPGLYPSYLWTVFGKGCQRQQRLLQLLAEQSGAITPSAVMSMLRDHGTRSNYDPACGLFGNEVCMHAGFGPVRTDQTTGALVSLLDSHPVHWFNASSAPCTGVFKPLWVDSGVPDLGVPATGQYCVNAHWWHHEELHREVLKDYPTRLALYRQERDDLETEFQRQAAHLREQGAEERRRFSERCFAQAEEATARWLSLVSNAPGDATPLLYRKAWQGFNDDALFRSAPQGSTVVP